MGFLTQFSGAGDRIFHSQGSQKEKADPGVSVRVWKEKISKVIKNGSLSGRNFKPQGPPPPTPPSPPSEGAEYGVNDRIIENDDEVDIDIEL